MTRFMYLIGAGWLWLVLAGCAPVGLPPVSPTLPPPPGEAGWVRAVPGVETRHIHISQFAEHPSVYIVRLDPAQVQFRVTYMPDEPAIFARVCKQPEVLAAINGGFFDERNRATALVISGGEASGSSYVGQGGMFAVDEGGAVSLRSLAEQPYSAGEPLVEALQSWPMLISPGGRLAYSNPEDEQRARRSVVAIDQAGHVLLLAFPTSSLTLHDLAAWLHESDLALDAALNLDGGSSTALCLDGAEVRRQIDPFTPLPLVLVVRPASQEQ